MENHYDDLEWHARHTGTSATQAQWWRHQIKTFSASLALCEGNPPVTDGFPSQRPVTWSLMFSLICIWTNGWENNRDAGDLRRHRAHCDVIAMLFLPVCFCLFCLCPRHIQIVTSETHPCEVLYSTRATSIRKVFQLIGRKFIPGTPFTNLY